MRGSTVLNLDNEQEEEVKYTYDKHLPKTKMRTFPDSFIIPQALSITDGPDTEVSLLEYINTCRRG